MDQFVCKQTGRCGRAKEKEVKHTTFQAIPESQSQAGIFLKASATHLAAVPAPPPRESGSYFSMDWGPVVILLGAQLPSPVSRRREGG